MLVSKIQDRNPCTKKGRGGRWSKIGMTSGEIWTVEESRNNLFAYIANRKNYKNWTREIFTSEKIIKSESNKRGLLSNLKT